MVNGAGGLADLLLGMALAQQKPQSLLSRLDPQTRAKVLASLAGFLILGFGMIALIWLGARVTRRYMNQGASLRNHSPDPDDWARKPLVPGDRSTDQQPSDDSEVE